MRFAILLCRTKQYSEAVAAYNTGFPRFQETVTTSEHWRLLEPSFDSSILNPVRLEASALVGTSIDLARFNLDNTLENLHKAIELRPNFATAHLFLSQFLVLDSHRDKFKKNLPEAARKEAEAKLEYQRAVSLGDNHIRAWAEEHLPQFAQRNK
jgi:hypothetical protein